LISIAHTNPTIMFRMIGSFGNPGMTTLVCTSNSRPVGFAASRDITTPLPPALPVGACPPHLSKVVGSSGTIPKVLGQQPTNKLPKTVTFCDDPETVDKIVVQSSGTPRGASDRDVDDVGVTAYQGIVTSKPLADIIGLSKFRDDRQHHANVAIARASYIGIDTVDEDDIVVPPTVGLVESVLQRVDRSLGKKKHCTKHRTANRWAKRGAVVKCLVDIVKFKAPAVFTTSRADIACLRLVVRNVIDEAVKDGVEFRGKTMTVRYAERNYYLKAVVSAYFIAEEDDEFWNALADAGEAITV